MFNFSTFNFSCSTFQPTSWNFTLRPLWHKQFRCIYGSSSCS